MPTNSKVYRNRIYFNHSILTNIDTAVIYEEFNTSFYISNNPVNVLARNNYQNYYTLYSVYRFYGNGCFNLFILDRDKPTLDKEMFDPTFTGWRGVFYRKTDKINGDLITQVTGAGSIGTITETFEFKGDTLLVHDRDRLKHIFIKRHIPKELLSFNADW